MDFQDFLKNIKPVTCSGFRADQREFKYVDIMFVFNAGQLRKILLELEVTSKCEQD